MRPEEHTCYKDDGGTPGRRCYACEAEPKEVVVVPYPTDQQRANIRYIAQKQMFDAMTYNPSTRTYTVTSVALAAAGILEPCR